MTRLGNPGMELDKRRRFSKDNAVEVPGQEAHTDRAARLGWELRGWPRTPNPAARRGAGTAREIPGCRLGCRKAIELAGKRTNPCTPQRIAGEAFVADQWESRPDVRWWCFGIARSFRHPVVGNPVFRSSPGRKTRWTQRRGDRNGEERIRNFRRQARQYRVRMFGNQLPKLD